MFDLSMVWVAPPTLTTFFSVEDYETILLLILHDRLAFIKKMIDFATKVKRQEKLLNIQVHQNMWQTFDGVVEALRLAERD